MKCNSIQEYHVFKILTLFFLWWQLGILTPLLVSISALTNTPGVSPFTFSIIEQSLYVYGAQKPYKDLPGDRLLSVEGISVEELVKHSSVMISHESDLQLLTFLSRELMLWHYNTLKELIPEWSNSERIRMMLKHPDGQIKEHILKIPERMTTSLHYAGSKIKLPSREKSEQDCLHVWNASSPW